MIGPTRIRLLDQLGLGLAVVALVLAGAALAYASGPSGADALLGTRTLLSVQFPFAPGPECTNPACVVVNFTIPAGAGSLHEIGVEVSINDACPSSCYVDAVSRNSTPSGYLWTLSAYAPQFALNASAAGAGLMTSGPSAIVVYIALSCPAPGHCTLPVGAAAPEVALVVLDEGVVTGFSSGAR